MSYFYLFVIHSPEDTRITPNELCALLRRAALCPIKVNELCLLYPLYQRGCTIAQQAATVLDKAQLIQLQGTRAVAVGGGGKGTGTEGTKFSLTEVSLFVKELCPSLLSSDKEQTDGTVTSTVKDGDTSVTEGGSTTAKSAKKKGGASKNSSSNAGTASDDTLISNSLFPPLPFLSLFPLLVPQARVLSTLVLHAQRWQRDVLSITEGGTSEEGGSNESNSNSNSSGGKSGTGKRHGGT